MKKVLLLVALAAALTGCGADDYDWSATKAKATAMCVDFGGKIKRMDFDSFQSQNFAFYARCINTSTGNEFSLSLFQVSANEKVPDNRSTCCGASGLPNV